MRRLLVSLALVLGTSSLAACSTGSSEESDTQKAATSADKGAFPVTLEHAFGKTTIDKEPKRVATLGWSEQDNVLALGVTPVGAPAITWGGNDKKSTPWFDEKLKESDAEAPTRYSDADGAPIEKIAELKPDLILATNSGITKAEYDKLSKLAPVVAYPDAPWVTDWKTSLEMDAKALGRTSLGEKLATETQKKITATAAKYPALKGKTFIYGGVNEQDPSKLSYYLPGDNRNRLLRDLGMKDAPYVLANQKKGQFAGSASAENSADLKSDVLITYASSDKVLGEWAQDPTFSQIPALKSGHAMASNDNTDALGLSAPSVLSIPYAMDNYIPTVAKTAEGKTTYLK